MMRVADNMTFDQVRHNVSKNRSDMADLQNHAATQKRVNKPSDDPMAASQVLGKRMELSGNKQFMKSLNYARSFLEYTDQSLEELTSHLVRAKELALSQANDASANDESRRVVAAEIAQIYSQMVQIGNRKLGDRFIFGGYNTLAAPFSAKGGYTGDAGEIMIHVDKDGFVPMNVPGSKIFHGVGLSSDGIVHATMAQPRTAEELEIERQQNGMAPNGQPHPSDDPVVRGPASSEKPQAETPVAGGVNLFKEIQRLHTGLQTNDKGTIQNSLDGLDSAVSQVVLTRSQVGSRVMVLDNALETLQKNKVDAHGAISQLEDADVFEVVSEINKNESTLQATLQTAGKIMPKSLLDFIR